MQLTVNVKIIRLANLYLAITNLGGIQVKGGSRPNAVEAAQSLFQVLGGVSGNSDDSLLAVSLAVHDTNLDAAVAGQLDTSEKRARDADDEEIPF